MLGAAIATANHNPAVARRLRDFGEALSAFVNAAIAVAEINEPVDVGPLLGR